MRAFEFQVTSPIFRNSLVSLAPNSESVRVCAALRAASIFFTPLMYNSVLVLFTVPFDWRARAFALDWKTARTSPWGMLLLFGGGLSLADAFLESGLSTWLGGMLRGMAGLPEVVVVLGVAVVFMFFTELASNAAVSAMAMPLLVAVAPALGQESRVLMTVAALASSCAFVLPVSTPPNTVAFSTGEVTVREMFRAGIFLNLTALVVITAAVMLLV